MRVILSMMLSLVMIVAATGQEPEVPWQASITGQIEALRAGDAEAALGFAGAAFRERYDDAERFLADVERSGYGAIISSRSHSFGEHTEADNGVIVQVVKLIDDKQLLWNAIYQVRNEPGEGWRVQGVVLQRAPGFGA